MSIDLRDPPELEHARLSAWLDNPLLSAADLERAERLVRALAETVDALGPDAPPSVSTTLTLCLADLHRHRVRGPQARALPSGPELDRALAAARVRMDGTRSPAFADLLRWRDAPPRPGGNLSRRAEAALARLVGALARGRQGVIAALQAAVDEGLDGPTALTHPQLGPLLRGLAQDRQ